MSTHSTRSNLLLNFPLFQSLTNDYVDCTCNLSPLCSDLAMVLDHLRLPACLAEHPLLDLILRVWTCCIKRTRMRAASMLATPLHEGTHALLAGHVQLSVKCICKQSQISCCVLGITVSAVSQLGSCW